MIQLTSEKSTYSYILTIFKFIILKRLLHKMRITLLVFGLIISILEVKADYNFTTKVFFCSHLNETINLEDSCGNIDNLMAKITCNNVINNLNLFKNILNDEFKTVFTLENKKIFYFLNGMVYETRCLEINYIEIIEEFESCTKFIQIKFLLNGIYMSGYLTKDEIIRTDSPSDECQTDEEIYLTLSNRANLVRRQNKISLIELKAELECSLLNLDNSLALNNSKLSFWGNINLNYERVLRYNGLYEFCRDFGCFFAIFLIVVFVIILFKKTKKLFSIRFFNKVIEKNEQIINIENQNLSYLDKLNAFEKIISEKGVNKPSAPPFEQFILNESQDIDRNYSKPIFSIFPNVSNKITCQYCGKACKNEFGLNVHLRTCKSK